MDTLDFVSITLLAGVVVGIVEVIKRSGMPSRWAGLAAIAIGILLAQLGGLAGRLDGNAWDLALIGILVGITAAGVWSIPKAVNTAVDHPPD